MRTAKELPAHLHAMANDLALAMLTDRGHRMNGALQTVERVFHAGRDQLETLVVVVSANFTLGHWKSLHANLDAVCSGAAAPNHLSKPNWGLHAASKPQACWGPRAGISYLRRNGR